MRKNDRSRIGTFSVFVDEMNGIVINFNPVLVESVDLPLRVSPVKSVEPIFDQFLHVSGAWAIEHVFVVEVRSPTSVLQTIPKILQHIVGYVDLERRELLQEWNDAVDDFHQKVEARETQEEVFSPRKRDVSLN